MTLLVALTDHQPRTDAHPYDVTQGGRFVKQLAGLDPKLARLLDRMLEKDWQKRPTADDCVELFHEIEARLSKHSGDSATGSVTIAAAKKLLAEEDAMSSARPLAPPMRQPLPPAAASRRSRVAPRDRTLVERWIAPDPPDPDPPLAAPPPPSAPEADLLAPPSPPLPARLALRRKRSDRKKSRKSDGS